MKKPTLEEISEVASFGYDEDGKLVLTKLKTDLIGDHIGNHWGDHIGEHWGDHIGDHVGNNYGNHVGEHWGKTYNPKIK
jgi:hypothetical protein